MSIEYREGRGINFTDLLKETGKENVPETLNGEEVSLMVEKVYDKLSPDLARCLVQSNVVLAMAGFKPRSDFFIDINSPEDTTRLAAEVEKFNKFLNNPQIRFRVQGKPFEIPEGKRLTQMLGVDSLLGWERMTRITKIPGVPVFDRQLGWNGFEKWHGNFIKGIEQAEKAGKIPADNDVPSGLMHGYPDQAILDFGDWYYTGRHKELKESNIPYTGIYSEAEPNYDFYPEHANDPAIKENIKKAGVILKEFYESKWHKQVAPSLQSYQRKDDFYV